VLQSYASVGTADEGDKEFRIPNFALFESILLGTRYLVLGMPCAVLVLHGGLDKLPVASIVH
jgi:hypothetical protein